MTRLGAALKKLPGKVLVVGYTDGSDPPTARTPSAWHQAMEWALLVMVGVHVAAAMAHLFIYRDRIMQRMLPQ